MCDLSTPLAPGWAAAVALSPLSLSPEQGLRPAGAPSGGGAGAAAVDGRDHLQGQVHCSPDQSDLPGEWGRALAES